MSTKHTATPTGPWKVVLHTYDDFADIFVTVNLKADNGTPFVSLLCVAKDLAPQTAEFIVRACNAHDDLVKTLQNLLQDAIALGVEDSKYSGVVIEARAALAKAGAA